MKEDRLRKIAPAGITLEQFGAAVEAGMEAWPSTVRVAASDRFYLFKGLDDTQIFLLERVDTR